MRRNSNRDLFLREVLEYTKILEALQGLELLNTFLVVTFPVLTVQTNALP
jgi:hypothetical protein